MADGGVVKDGPQGLELAGENTAPVRLQPAGAAPLMPQKLHGALKLFACGRQGEFSLLDAQGRFKMDAALIGLGFRFHTLPLLDVRSCCGFTWHDYTGTARAEQRTNRPGLGKYGQKPCICGGNRKSRRGI